MEKLLKLFGIKTFNQDTPEEIKLKKRKMPITAIGQEVEKIENEIYSNNASFLGLLSHIKSL